MRSNHTKWVLLSNQKGISQTTYINLYPNKYSQELHNYSYVVKWDWCVRSCNILNDI